MDDTTLDNEVPLQLELQLNERNLQVLVNLGSKNNIMSIDHLVKIAAVSKLKQIPLLNKTALDIIGSVMLEIIHATER